LYLRPSSPTRRGDEKGTKQSFLLKNMKNQKEKKIKQAIKHELKGDSHAAKKNWGPALKAYQKSMELHPENLGIYQKLETAKFQMEGPWTEDDFSQSLSWVMKRQELENPLIETVHESLSPEYQQIKTLIAGILLAAESERDPLILRLRSFKEKAVGPLLETLFDLDQILKKHSDPS
jgi:hypothetical protein